MPTFFIVKKEGFELCDYNILIINCAFFRTVGLFSIQIRGKLQKASEVNTQRVSLLLGFPTPWILRDGPRPSRQRCRLPAPPFPTSYPTYPQSPSQRNCKAIGQHEGGFEHPSVFCIRHLISGHCRLPNGYCSALKIRPLTKSSESGK